VTVYAAPLGPDAWLNGGAYVGTLELAKLHGKMAVHIRFFKVQYSYQRSSEQKT